MMMVDTTIIKGLYAITPDQEDNDFLISQVLQVIKGGVKLIQYRSKILHPNQKKILSPTAMLAQVLFIRY